MSKSGRSTSGALFIGRGKELDAAFNAVAEGLRLGRHKDELRHHCEVLEDAYYRAALSPEASDYLDFHPTLKRRVEAHFEKSGRRRDAANRSFLCEGRAARDKGTA